MENECKSIADSLKAQRLYENNDAQQIPSKDCDDISQVLQNVRVQREQCISKLENSISCIENMLNEIAEELMISKEELRNEW